MSLLGGLWVAPPAFPLVRLFLPLRIISCCPWVELVTCYPTASVCDINVVRDQTAGSHGDDTEALGGALEAIRRAYPLTTTGLAKLSDPPPPARPGRHQRAAARWRCRRRGDSSGHFVIVGAAGPTGCPLPGRLVPTAGPTGAHLMHPSDVRPEICCLGVIEDW